MRKLSLRYGFGLLCLLWIAGPPMTARCFASGRTVLHIPFTAQSENTPIIQLGFMKHIESIDYDVPMTGTVACDTGCNYSLMTDTMASKIGLTPQSDKTPTGNPMVYDGKAAQFVQVRKLSLGGMTLENVWFEIFPEDRLRAIVGKTADGVLGNDVLARFALEFDYQKRQMTVWTGGNLTASDLTQAGFADAISIPVTQGEDTRFYGEARINEIYNLRYMVDTGAEVTIVASNIVDKLELRGGQPSGPAHTFGGDFPLRQAKLRELEVGSLKYNNYIINYNKNISERLELEDMDMILGMDILGQYRVLIDGPKRRMYLKAAPRVRSGLTVPIVSHANGCPVVELRMGNALENLGSDFRLNRDFLWDTAVRDSFLANSVADTLSLPAVPNVGAGDTIMVQEEPASLVRIPSLYTNGVRESRTSRS